MGEQINLQNMLNRKYLEMKVRNPSFSLRAFARKLEIQPSPLSEILKGKRRVSRMMAQKFAVRLMLDPTESMYILKDFPAVDPSDTAPRKKSPEGLQLMRLNAEQFNLISDWAHFAILGLMNTKGFISDPHWMAERLQIKVEKVGHCLERLFELGFVKHGENGELLRTNANVNSSDDVTSISIQKSHLVDLDVAKEKLTSCNVTIRDFTSITIPFDEELMPQVKTMIRRFQSEVYELMRNHEPREVYKMNTYLYPLTGVRKEEKHDNEIFF